MLNLNKGKPIAYIRGDQYDGEILHIDDNENNSKNETESSSYSSYENSNEDNEDNEDSEDSEEGVYFGEHVKLKHCGRFEPIPEMVREVNYICGKSGSGKSTMAAMIADKYKRLKPNRPIYLFSVFDKDPALDYLGLFRIKMDENLINNPIDIQKEIKGGALIIFDDVNPQTIFNKKLKEAIEKLKLEILEYGRKNNIDCIFTSHLINPNDRNFGRIIMNELTKLVIFPKRGGSYSQQSYALTKHMGFSKKEAKQILDLESRWVLVSNTSPEYILTEKECILPKALRS